LFSYQHSGLKDFARDRLRKYLQLSQAGVQANFREKLPLGTSNKTCLKR
jgi:hypothetical protein